MQIDNIRFFSLLNALLLLLKENIIFPGFCGKYERKRWYVFISFAMEYFSWTLYCKIFFVSIFALLFVKFLPENIPLPDALPKIFHRKR